MATDVIHSIGPGGDYTSLALWAAAAPSSLVTADQRWIGEVLNTELSVSNTVTLSSSCSATQCFVLRAAAGASFRDNPNAATNPLRYNPSVGAAITANIGYYPTLSSGGSVYFEIGRLQFRATGTGGGFACLGFANGSNLGGYVHDCIVSCATTSAGRSLYIWRAGTSCSVVVENVVAVSETTGSASIVIGGNNGTVRNCTIVSVGGTNSVGVQAEYAYATCWNNAIFNHGEPIHNQISGTAGGNNATDKSSFGTSNVPTSPGTTGVAYSTANFKALSGVTYGTGTGYDFRLAANSNLIDGGGTASVPAADILGTTRPQGAAPDIGAYEYSASGSSTPGPLAGTAAATATASGTFAARISLAGAASVNATATAGLAGKGGLAGTAPSSAASNASLAGAGALAGNASAVAAASGTLAAMSGAPSLSGMATANASASGTLAGSGALTANASAQTASTATLSGSGALAGVAALTSSASGTFGSQATLSGVASAGSAASGTLAGTGAMAGTASALTAAQGNLAGQGALTGAGLVQTSASGTLAAQASGALVGSAGAVSAATGILTGLGAMSGAASATANASASLSGQGSLIGTAQVQAQAQGTLAALNLGLAGQAAAISVALGTLSGRGALSGNAGIVSSGSILWRPRFTPSAARTIKGLAASTRAITGTAGASRSL